MKKRIAVKDIYGNRIEPITVGPTQVRLKGFLRHMFARANMNPDERVLEPNTAPANAVEYAFRLAEGGLSARFGFDMFDQLVSVNGANVFVREAFITKPVEELLTTRGIEVDSGCDCLVEFRASSIVPGKIIPVVVDIVEPS